MVDFRTAIRTPLRFVCTGGAHCEKRIGQLPMETSINAYLVQFLEPHIAFPGIGHVRLDQGRYEWVPANYSLGL